MSAISTLIRLATVLAASACGAALAAAPVCVDPGGIGGTGAPQMSSPSRPAAAAPGIGGTGAPLARAPGGMGGTGDPARGGIGGTGIVGTITGFASICVNGVEVHYGNDVPVRENGVAARLERLAVGQVVAVDAGTSERGLEARGITIVHALEGPVTSPPDQMGSMRVMNQTVLLAPDARVPSRLRPGEPVRVSGLRNARGEVVATRIDRAPGLSDASAVGLVREPGRLDGLRLGGRIVPTNREMLVRGRWNGATLEVQRAEIDPSIPFAGRAREALVEGLVHEHKGDRLELGGFSVRLGPGAVDPGAERLSAGRRVRVSGEFRGAREIEASRIEILRPEREKESNSRRGSSKVEWDDDKGASEAGESRDRSGSNRRGGEPDEKDDRPERRERIETDERSERSGRSERIERTERTDRAERAERNERVEKPEKAEKLEKRERLERIDRNERVDRIDRPDHD